MIVLPVLVPFVKEYEFGKEGESLLSFLKEHPNKWEENTIRQNYPGTAHSDTKSIFLREPKEFTKEWYMDKIYVQDSEDLSLCMAAFTLVNDFVKRMNVKELGYILLVDLLPYGVIDEHIDEGNYADYFKRSHLVLSSDNVLFKCGDEELYMEEGVCYTFNHKLLHSVRNFSDSHRIHLIIDWK